MGAIYTRTIVKTLPVEAFRVGWQSEAATAPGWAIPNPKRRRAALATALHIAGNEHFHSDLSLIRRSVRCIIVAESRSVR
jgi:hypothetical protein